jgi:TIR domain-containing protein
MPATTAREMTRGPRSRTVRLLAPLLRLWPWADTHSVATARTPNPHRTKPPDGNLTAQARDVFVSHASEDKQAIARPLADSLSERGLTVWFDEYELVLGDSLRGKIDDGLARSTIGVVVLSHAFFAKPWPRRELDGLTARLMSGENNVIVPIWHDLTEQELLRYSPPLADLLAGSSADGVEALVDRIERVLVLKTNGLKSLTPEVVAPPGSVHSPTHGYRIARGPRMRITRIDRLTRALVASGVASVVAAAVVFGVVDRSGGARATTYKAGHLTVSARSQWHVARDVSFAGLAPAQSLSNGKTNVVIGALPLSAPAGALSTAVLHSVGNPSESIVTMTASGPTRRYRWKTGRALYMISTDDGELAVGCSASIGSQPASATFSDCAEVAATATVRGAAVEYPGVPSGLTKDVAAAVKLRAASISRVAGVAANDLGAIRAGLVRFAAADTHGAYMLNRLAATARYSGAISKLRSAFAWEAQAARVVAGDERQSSRARFETQRAKFDVASVRLAAADEAVRRLGVKGSHVQAITLPRMPIPTPVKPRESPVTVLAEEKRSPKPSSSPPSPEPVGVSKGSE